MCETIKKIGRKENEIQQYPRAILKVMNTKHKELQPCVFVSLRLLAVETTASHHFEVQ